MLAASRFLVGDRRRDEIDNKIDALAAGSLLHLLGPAWIAGIEREITAEFAQAGPSLGIGRGADHQRSAEELADLHAKEPNAGAGALHQHGLAAL